MLNATQPLLGWAIASLVWMYAMALLSAIGSITALSATRDTYVFDDFDGLSRAICFFVSIAAPVVVAFASVLSTYGIVLMVATLWCVQGWKMYDLLECAHNSLVNKSKRRTGVTVATSLVTIVAASVLAFGTV